MKDAELAMVQYMAMHLLRVVFAGMFAFVSTGFIS